MKKPNPFKEKLRTPLPYLSKRKYSIQRIPATNNAGEKRSHTWDLESILKNKNFFFQGPVILQMLENDEVKYKDFITKYLAARKFRKDNFPSNMRPIAEESMELFNRFSKGEITTKQWASMAGVKETKITYLIGRIYARKLQESKTTN